jgi:hypothetical protein
MKIGIGMRKMFTVNARNLSMGINYLPERTDLCVGIWSLKMDNYTFYKKANKKGYDSRAGILIINSEDKMNEFMDK